GGDACEQDLTIARDLVDANTIVRYRELANGIAKLVVAWHRYECVYAVELRQLHDRRVLGRRRVVPAADDHLDAIVLRRVGRVRHPLDRCGVDGLEAVFRRQKETTFPFANHLRTPQRYSGPEKLEARRE